MRWCWCLCQLSGSRSGEAEVYAPWTGRIPFLKKIGRTKWWSDQLVVDHDYQMICDDDRSAKCDLVKENKNLVWLSRLKILSTPPLMLLGPVFLQIYQKKVRPIPCCQKYKLTLLQGREIDFLKQENKQQKKRLRFVCFQNCFHWNSICSQLEELIEEECQARKNDFQVFVITCICPNFDFNVFEFVQICFCICFCICSIFFSFF